jgi:ABC-2 type transport system permease protein
MVSNASEVPKPYPWAAWIGWRTLFAKEVRRFWKVGFQTMAAPVLTALLYLLIFGHVLGQEATTALATGQVLQGSQVSYTAFLIPGLVMMSVLQNAFANTSSSLIQSKVMGSLVFVLLAPFSPWVLLTAYVAAAVVRGLSVGGAVWLLTAPLVMLPLAHPLWVVMFAALSAAILGTLGLIAGLWAEKFDHLAAFQNFFITPLTFLSGVFYSLHSLPTFWQTLSHFNPFFYMIDGFRYGFFGHSDVSPVLSLMVVVGTACVMALWAFLLLARGYKLRA